METFIVLSPGFPADENDSTCLPPLQKFALSLKQEFPNIEFYFIAFQYPFQKKEYTWHGMNVICMGGANQSGIKRIITWIKVFRKLRKLKKQKKIIGLLSWWLTETALIGKIFSKLHGLQHYMWLNGQDAKKTNQYINRIKPKANEIIAMSDFLKETYFKNHGEKPFMVAENGVWTKDYPSFNHGKRSYDIIAVGSLIAIKNYDLFIDIISELVKHHPNLRVGLAGKGALEFDLKSKVQKMNLENNIHFLGLLEHHAVLEGMNDSKIFLHTSHYEGNSTVLMEALYCGCYVFSTQALANREVERLKILSEKASFVKAISDTLQLKSLVHRPVLFNAMPDTAKKIMALYLP